MLTRLGKRSFDLIASDVCGNLLPRTQFFVNQIFTRKPASPRYRLSWYGNCRTRLDSGPDFISKDLNLRAFMHGVTLDFSRLGKPTDNAFIESLNGKFRAERLNANWSSASTRRSERARLGVETTTRCARTAPSATKCLRRFIGRPAIPASPPPDEAGFSSGKWSKVRGKFKWPTHLLIAG